MAGRNGAAAGTAFLPPGGCAMARAMQELSDKREVGSGLKLLLELGPVALFVIAYTQGHRIAPALGLTGILERPIFLATLVLMVATPLAIGISWLKTRTIPVMPAVTLAVVTVFGALTLWLQDDYFIKIKPTIVNCIFGSVLLVGLLFGRSFLRIVLDSAMSLDDAGWRTLTLRWGLFFFFLAAVNEVVWRTQSEAFWVGFKLWGMMGLTFLFVLAQTPVILRHQVKEDA